MKQEESDYKKAVMLLQRAFYEVIGTGNTSISKEDFIFSQSMAIRALKKEIGRENVANS